MNYPLVSVIMVVKNGEPYFPAAVESVLTQDYRPLEIIVVDGQSVDSTAALAQAIPGVVYISQLDQGLANARNCGLEVAQGEFIAFLDADDLWTPGKLSTQVNHLCSHPEIQATITRLHFILEPEFVLHHAALVDHYAQDPVGYTPSALVAHRDVFLKVGLFDAEYSLGCDADWFARMLDSNVPVAVLPDVLMYKRIHDANLSLNTVQAKKEILLALRSSLLRKRNEQTNNV